MTKYMHTLNNEPAGFDGTQVCFWNRRVPLADSLKQIRAEQKASIAYRNKHHGGDNERYGYVTVKA